ncbi:GNAT family N-acetyltransferase [Paenibacillus sp. FSL R7-0345]|uniref:GNAT family N-acetyltransferase n=1 Tax=Paenibacillus sp. FSL R7-0345 TaxID=2954535 RepID=UPI00315ABCFF
MNEITFEPVIELALDEFKKRLQTAFSLAIIAMNEKASDEPIPSDQDIERNYYNKEAETYNVYKSGQRVGGIIVSINHLSNHNHLDFFFIDPEHHSKGIGFEVWRAIEEKYPETEIWQTGTPYFEKRNIHFYVNKCGFQINEFFCEHHPDPHGQQEDLSDDSDGFDDGFFNFIKFMKNKTHKAD